MASRKELDSVLEKTGPHFMDCDRVKIEFERKKYLNREDQNKIFDFQPTIAYKDDEYDVAVLELKPHVANAPFPQALEFFGEVCDGEIHLVGHPGGRQMKEDSDVTPFWLPRHMHIIYDYVKSLSQWSIATFPNREDYYEDLLKLPRKIMFHTTFDKGSSGSPGFMLRNEKPCVVLMLRGGTPSCFYENLFPSIVVNDNQKVEFGYAMSDIYFKMWNSTNSSIKNIASEIFPKWHNPQDPS
uniref:Uncharacterized protein n=1 Tax=Magallana gigas TaxID=29159 RepID=K1QZY9_MAGGI